MHASISKVNLQEEYSFTVRFSNQEIVIDIDRISSLLHIPRSNGPKFVSDFLSLDERNAATEFLCGKAVPWREGNFIPAFT